MESDKNCAICGTETHSSNSRKFGNSERTLCRDCGALVNERIEYYADGVIDFLIKERKLDIKREE